MIRRRRKPARFRAANHPGLGLPKGPTRRQLKDKATRAERKATTSIRKQVFARERDLCRCCLDYFGRRTPATSMHEIRFRSLGGVRSLENSIAVCGTGTTLCHGELQRYRILCEKLTDAGADGPLKFRRNDDGGKWARFQAAA